MEQRRNGRAGERGRSQRKPAELRHRDMRKSGQRLPEVRDAVLCGEVRCAAGMQTRWVAWGRGSYATGCRRGLCRKWPPSSSGRVALASVWSREAPGVPNPPPLLYPPPHQHCSNHRNSRPITTDSLLQCRSFPLFIQLAQEMKAKNRPLLQLIPGKLNFSQVIDPYETFGAAMPNCIPDFVNIGFSGLPPTMVANLKTYSRQKEEDVSRGYPRFLRPFIPALLHAHLSSLSSALKTSLLRFNETRTAVYTKRIGAGWCSGYTTLLPHWQIGFRFPVGSPPDFRTMGFVPDDAAGRRVFSGISRFPGHLIPVLFHTYLASPLSALKTSVLRAGKISPRPFPQSGCSDCDLHFGAVVGATAASSRELRRVYTRHKARPGAAVVQITRCRVDSPPALHHAYTSQPRVSRQLRHQSLKAVHNQCFTQPECGHAHNERTATPTLTTRLKSISRACGCWNEREEGTGYPRENPLTSGIVQYYSHLQKSGVDRTGLNPVRLASEVAISLTRKSFANERLVTSSSAGSRANRDTCAVCQAHGPFLEPHATNEREGAQTSKERHAIYLKLSTYSVTPHPTTLVRPVIHPHFFPYHYRSYFQHCPLERAGVGKVYNGNNVNPRHSLSSDTRGDRSPSRPSSFSILTVPTKAIRAQSPPGSLRIFACENRADAAVGRRVFSGISRFPCLFSPALLRTSIILIGSQDLGSSYRLRRAIARDENVSDKLSCRGDDIVEDVRENRQSGSRVLKRRHANIVMFVNKGKETKNQIVETDATSFWRLFLHETFHDIDISREVCPSTA
ncbi:hypothetical protein PR048_008981 [Dryococelus australis]|uniref:Uncharacterized protein n=1 Tax=Dryococelus australis TaxID=614101 RepID=A0ABQ9HYM3_9NEOP|nr:hypothetical protein PR048_008981 [Dryococelus australis]